MKNKILKVLFGTFMLFILVIVTNVGFQEIYSLPDNFVASYDEIVLSNRVKKFGTLISTDIEKEIFKTGTKQEEYDYIVFKLFNLIPIRKVKIKLAPEEDVYVGGVPIGLELLTNGAIFVGESAVECENGLNITSKTEKFRKGDMIYQVDGKDIKTINDIKNIVNNSENEDIEVKFLRKNKEMKSIIKRAKDKEENLKLGLLVKDDVSGIGTLTYVNTKTGKFGAVGHAITESENLVNVLGGKVYVCNIFGVQKGEKNNPGQLKGVFLQNSGEKGKVESNNKYGVFGVIDDKTDLVDENILSKIGGRLSVSPGKAKIVSSVSGIREEYDIEIIKASYQSKANEKSIVFRVLDKRLLNLTGGIVQGMSGSPIIQNGKLVGAVTHVFTSDPTKGYGVYSDWMVLNS